MSVQIRAGAVMYALETVFLGPFAGVPGVAGERLGAVSPQGS